MEDNGIGIKDEDKSKLFKLFGFLESSKELNTQGVGLGLHISKRITEMFDGDMICISEYGKGTNFIFVVVLTEDIVTGKKDSMIRILNPI